MTDESEKDTKPRHGPAPVPRQDLPISTSRRSAATRCPFCTAPLRAGQPVSRCAGCGARLHLGCLGESGHTGCPVCQGTVFAEAVTERHMKRLRVAARETTLQAIAAPVGALVGILTTPLSCFVTIGLVEGLGEHMGPLVLLFLLAPLVIPLGAGALAVHLLRRAARWQIQRRIASEAASKAEDATDAPIA